MGAEQPVGASVVGRCPHGCAWVWTRAGRGRRLQAEGPTAARLLEQTGPRASTHPKILPLLSWCLKLGILAACCRGQPEPGSRADSGRWAGPGPVSRDSSGVGGEGGRSSGCADPRPGLRRCCHLLGRAGRAGAFVLQPQGPPLGQGRTVFADTSPHVFCALGTALCSSRRVQRGWPPPKGKWTSSFALA